MFYLGEAPQRWKRHHDFLSRDSYQDPHMIPTCCGPWHNGADHIVTFYLCHEYWTILDPLRPSEASYPALETQLHSVLRESFTHRGLPPPHRPPDRRVVRIAVQNDAPLHAWSCGTFAMSTTLQLLLIDKHPHEMPPSCITRGHMLALHEALLMWLLTGTPLPFL